MPSTDSATTPTLSKHTWPWTTEELLTVPAMGALIAGLTWVITTVARMPSPWDTALQIALGLTTMGLIIRLGKKRKSAASFTLTFEGNKATVHSPGILGHSETTTQNLTSVSHRAFGSDECFLLNDGNNTLRLPLRAVLNNDTAHSLITATMSRPDIRIDAEARALYERHVA